MRLLDGRAAVVTGGCARGAQATMTESMHDEREASTKLRAALRR